jgi:hypothetical protein
LQIGNIGKRLKRAGRALSMKAEAHALLDPLAAREREQLLKQLARLSEAPGADDANR